MATHTTDLRTILTRQKPTIPCSAPGNRNTLYHGWPPIQDSATLWSEFNLETLNLSYGKILDFAAPANELLCPRPDESLVGLVVKTANDTKHMISWNDALMRPCLSFAKSHLRLHEGTVIRHKHSTADEKKPIKLPNRPNGPGVDHVIWLDHNIDVTLLVGLGRPSSMWSGTRAVSPNGRKDLLSPLRQLGNICKTANTRYGYIQTDEELVACRFSKESGSDKLKVALMPVKWSKHGPNVLTTDLALWWLAMLAMSDKKHRVILPEGDMDPLDSWDPVFLDGRRGFGYRHRYSLAEETTVAGLPSFDDLWPADNTAGAGDGVL